MGSEAADSQVWISGDVAAERAQVERTRAVDENGVDLTLIRESLERSPLERLDLADAYAQEIELLRSLVRTA